MIDDGVLKQTSPLGLSRGKGFAVRQGLAPRLSQSSREILLSRQQVEALQLADVSYRQKMDSLWTELATHFASLPDNYSIKQAALEQESAADSAWELSRLEAKRLNTILTPTQLRLLPFPAGMLYSATKLIKGMRIYVVQ